ncbi:MAG: hypothetical protein EOO28_31445, partial [Comamonadaceae bacterium]
LFDGTSFMVNGLMIIDERKLLELSDKDALEIFRSGELSWVYAHLVSLSNMNRLVDKLADHKRAEPAAKPADAAPAALAIAPAPAAKAAKSKA